MSRGMKWGPLAVFCALIIAVSSVWANWAQDGVALCTATDYQKHPTITSDGASGAIVVWEDCRSGNYDIYAQRVDATGATLWTADGVALCTATGYQTDPAIVSDGAGGAIVAWIDGRTGIDSDIYAMRVDASGAALWTAGGVALCTATGGQYHPAIISDGAGGAIVTWTDGREGIEYVYDIYAQRVDASGAVQWATDGIILCVASGNQYFPEIASDGAGGAIVVWTDARDPVNWNIYAQRVNAWGAVQWTADGIALCAETRTQGLPDITSDGAGGAIVAWYDDRASSGHIYAQRVNASGAVQWTVNGVALCPATEGQSRPVIVSDGAGGAIVAWEDHRRGLFYDNDIYAQRVDASGAAQWTADGVALCTAYGTMEYLRIISDDEAGAIITWEDGRLNHFDIIYAQRVNATGIVQWTDNGVALCGSVLWNQRKPQITSDGLGGAIITWIDSRTGIHSDIYAMRVDANGFAPPTAVEAPAVPIELHQNYPNPFNPTTTLTYSIPEKGTVVLQIYNVTGKLMTCLVNKQQEKGFYEMVWNGRDEKGNLAASGIYFCRLTVGTQNLFRKIVLLR